MDPKKFKENLLLYGPDVNKWPEAEKQAGADLRRHFPELQSLCEEQEEFERILKTRKYEEPSRNLAQRIVSLSLNQNIKAPSRLGLFFSGLFADNFYLPKPAFWVVSIFMVTALMAGFFIGFSNPTGATSTDQGPANLQAFLHHEGDGLWAKE
jgi:hypothetical protein